MYKTNSKRIPTEEGRDLIGKWVRVVSNASHRNYKKYGRIVGTSADGKYMTVYIGETDCCANFCRGSLELLN